MKSFKKKLLLIGIVCFLAAGLLLMPAYAAAAGAGTSGVQKASAQVSPSSISLDFRDADIDQVLKLFSLASGLTVIKDPSVVGTVTIINPNKLSIDEALGVLESMLAVRGFTIKKEDHLITVVPVPKASSSGVQLGLKVDDSINSKIITQVIQLDYADAAELKAELAPVLSERANLMVSEQTNTLIVTDFAENVKRLADVIAGIEKLGAPERADSKDTAGNAGGDPQAAQKNTKSSTKADSQITKVIYIKYANATDLARELSQVFTSQQQNAKAATGGVQDIPIEQRLLGVAQALTSNAVPAQAQAAQQSQSRANARQDNSNRNQGSNSNQTGVKIVANVYSNSLVVMGSPESVAEVEAVIDSIDKEGAASVTYIYHVRNGSASDLASLISAIFTTSSATNQKQNKAANQTASNKNTATAQTNQQNVQRAQTQNQNQAARQTTQQSQATTSQGTANQKKQNNKAATAVSSVSASGRPRVSGDLKIVPNDVSNTILIFGPMETIDEIKQLLTQIDMPTPQVLIEAMIVEASLEDGSKLGISWDGLSNGSGSGTQVDWGANPVQGLKYQIIADGVKAVMETVKNDSRFKVLSTPKIMTVNNSSARMYVGQRVPYLRSSNITNDGRVVNTYDFQNVGVTLQVFPRITESGYIGLDVNQTSSEVMANAAAGAPPTISTREAQTSVMVKHGETVVIGGIIRENKTDQIKKIPILGDIPLIGALFRRTETTTAKSELLVFITPYIIRNDTDAITITQYQQQNSEEIRDSIIKPKPVPLSSSVNGESVENIAAGESAPVEDGSQK